MPAHAAEIRAFRCLEDNIGVLVRDARTGACAAIDAPEEAAILRALDETGWTLTDILVTHRHRDHTQGIAALKARFGCRVVAPARAGAEIPAVDLAVGEGDAVAVGSLEGRVWETPGHCADHVTYWFEGASVVFPGDTLFTLGCGRVSESPFPVMWDSLKRLAALPEETRAYTGHDYVLSNARFAQAADPDNAAVRARAGEAERLTGTGGFMIPTTIGEERATNPFLRAAEPALARSVGLPAGSDPAAVFQALREWKNRF